MITGAQIRAARSLLGMHQLELCRRAGVSRASLHNFETGKSDPALSTVEKLVRALEDAGVELIDQGQQISQGRGAGVRLKQ